jgi:hypothetical protein
MRLLYSGSSFPSTRNHGTVAVSIMVHSRYSNTCAQAASRPATVARRIKLTKTPEPQGRNQRKTEMLANIFHRFFSRLGKPLHLRK